MSKKNFQLTSILLDNSNAPDAKSWNLFLGVSFFIIYKSINLTAMYKTS